MSGKRATREVAEGWNVNISYAADGSVVEIVMLDFMASTIEPTWKAQEPDGKFQSASKAVQTAKTQPSRLMLSPKALQKALEQSAKQAQRLADAFGLVVPGIKPKNASGQRNPGS